MSTEMMLSLLLLIVGVFILVGIHICIVNRAFGLGSDNSTELVNQTNNTNGGGGGGVLKRKIKEEELKELPSFEFKQDFIEEGEKDKEGSGGSLDCVICLEDFKVGDKCRTLPNCNHSFHVICIDYWLLKTPVCPICRACVMTEARDDKSIGGGSEGDSVIDIDSDEARENSGEM